MDPLHQFCINKLIPINIAGIDISFSNSALSMLFAISVFLVLFFSASKRNELIPSRLQALGELAYKGIADMVESNAGTKGIQFVPFVFSVFFFVLGGNLFGMIPYNFTYTSHIIVTLSLAMIVFLFVTILGFCMHGMHFCTFFVPKGVPIAVIPLVVPIEIISYLSRPFSLAIRLFANMMAGHTMMKIFAGFCTSLGVLAFMPLLVNVVLTGFEIIVCCLQAYVFSILTCLYLHDAIYLH